MHQPGETDTVIPDEFTLEQNWPNPFNPETTISFGIPDFEQGDGGHVILEVFNLQGKRIRMLVNEQRAPGTYSVIWNGRDESGSMVSSSVYIYRPRAGGKTQSRKMLLMK